MAQILLMADWMSETEEQIFCVYGPEASYFKEAMKEDDDRYVDEAKDDKWAMVEMPDDLLKEFSEVSERYWTLQDQIHDLFRARRDELEEA